MSEKTFIADDGAKISYSVLGEENETTILFIHGWATDRRCYEKMVPIFSKKFRVVLPDLRGFGKSEKKSPFITVRMIKDMAKLYEIEQADVVLGHSWGGLIAQGVSIFKNPVSTIILSSFAKWTKPFYGWFFKKIMSFLEDRNELVERIIEIAYGSKRESTIVDIIKKLDKEVLKESAEDILAYDNTNNLKMINSPTLIIHGNNDKIVSLKHAFYLNEHIRKSKLVTIPSCTHDIIREEPELLFSIISGWIELIRLKSS